MNKTILISLIVFSIVLVGLLSIGMIIKFKEKIKMFFKREKEEVMVDESSKLIDITPLVKKAIIISNRNFENENERRNRETERERKFYEANKEDFQAMRENNQAMDGNFQTMRKNNQAMQRHSDNIIDNARSASQILKEQIEREKVIFLLQTTDIETLCGKNLNNNSLEGNK